MNWIPTYSLKPITVYKNKKSPIMGLFVFNEVSFCLKFFRFHLELKNIFKMKIGFNHENSNSWRRIRFATIYILDINLINGSGLDILKILKKEKKKFPVLIISANNSLEDKLEGLDLGADDYLTKPFHLAELNSRIKAILRRGKFGGNATISFNEIKIDTESRTVYINDKIIEVEFYLKKLLQNIYGVIIWIWLIILILFMFI